MLTLSELYQNILWLSVPLFLISVAVMIYCIDRLITSKRQALILDIPLMEQQEIKFAQTGPVVLSIEGPLFTTRFNGLSYKLSTSDGRSIRGRRTVFRNSTSGLLNAKTDLMIYCIPEPGCYNFKVEGLGDTLEKDADHRLVFSRPHMASVIGYLLGITLGSMSLFGSLVFSLLRLTQ